jgi:hypothetical protein
VNGGGRALDELSVRECRIHVSSREARTAPLLEDSRRRSRFAVDPIPDEFHECQQQGMFKCWMFRRLKLKKKEEEEKLKLKLRRMWKRKRKRTPSQTVGKCNSGKSGRAGAGKRDPPSIPIPIPIPRPQTSS